jgi:hypothetical protein
MPRRIRKQVHELTAADFEAQPCWEYAENEEGRTGQDECTVRPLPLAELASVQHQVFVQAAFFFPNGRIRTGIVTLNAGNDPSGTQPVLLCAEASVYFYAGSSEPSASEVKQFARQLGKISKPHLPVYYATSLRSKAGVPLASGVLEGMYWLANWRTGKLRAVA